MMVLKHPVSQSNLTKGKMMENEKDPDGINQHEVGAKLDVDKPKAALVLGGFPLALMEVVKVGTFGANKYSPNGWKAVSNGEARYMDAAMRHILADMNNETVDKDSQCLHLAQAVWNLLAVIEFRVD